MESHGDLECTHTGKGLSGSQSGLGRTSCDLRTQDERLVGSGDEAISHWPPHLPGEAVVQDFLLASQVLLRNGAFCSTPAAPCLRTLVQLAPLLSCSRSLAGLPTTPSPAPVVSASSLLLCGQGSWQAGTFGILPFTACIRKPV